MRYKDNRDDPINLGCIGFHANQAGYNANLIREIITGKEKGEYSERIDAISDNIMNESGISKEDAIDMMLSSAKSGLEKDAAEASRLIDWVFGKK